MDIIKILAQEKATTVILVLGLINESRHFLKIILDYKTKKMKIDSIKES
ncbi:hypothetical protein [Allofustis seminis]|nr:hypothetical protein [Allofustis seminis]